MIGKTISHYKIIEKLGEGGMGVVYKAHDTKLDRLVALKFLPAHLSKTDDDKARFLREAKAAAALNHNNVCTIHEINDDEENLFIVMEYVEGKTLKEIIQDCQKESIPISTVIDYTAQIGEALKTAHVKGIVHRDIKAENIMITATGVVKVMDFGLAKLSGSAQLTKDTSTLGTVAYMSPEQIEGKEVDARADIFSFAVVLYEMLSCRMPFRGEYDSATMYAIINEEPEPIQKHRSDLSSEMLHVLNRALEKNPEERYQNVNDMLIDLKRVTKELSSDKTEYPKTAWLTEKKPMWKKPVPVVTGVLAVMVIIIGIVWLSGKDDNTYPDKSIAVLPFDPINKTLNDTIDCDSFHDALITQLQKIGDLHHPWTRSFMINYRNPGKPITEIARELNVRYIVAATFAREDDSINVNVKLFDGTNGEILWAENYIRNYSKILAVRREVAQAIAGQCKAKITTKERYAMEYIPTRNMEALDNYERGIWHWGNKFTIDGHQKAARMLERAVSLDSNFVLAYALLSDVHSTLYGQGVSESYIKARKALTRAEQLDPDLPEVHRAKGSFLFKIDRDFNGAIEEYNKALAGDPNNWANYRDIGLCYSAQENYDKALVYFLKCNEIEQNAFWALASINSVYISQNKWSEADKYADLMIDKYSDMAMGYIRKAVTYIYGYGKMDKARDLLNTAWELVEEQNGLITALWTVEIFERDLEAAIEINERNPKAFGYPWRKAYIFYLMGKNDEAITIYDSLRVEVDRWVEISPKNVVNYRVLGYIHAQMGKRDEAITECMKAEEFLPGSMLTAKRLADIYIITGEHNKAIEKLKELLDVPGSDVTLWDLRLNPFYDPLRKDPKFIELIK